jgi:hypothetical protein
VVCHWPLSYVLVVVAEVLGVLLDMVETRSQELVLDPCDAVVVLTDAVVVLDVVVVCEVAVDEASDVEVKTELEPGLELELELELELLDVDEITLVVVNGMEAVVAADVMTVWTAGPVDVGTVDVEPLLEVLV